MFILLVCLPNESALYFMHLNYFHTQLSFRLITAQCDNILESNSSLLNSNYSNRKVLFKLFKKLVQLWLFVSIHCITFETRLHDVCLCVSGCLLADECTLMRVSTHAHKHTHTHMSK